MISKMSYLFDIFPFKMSTFLLLEGFLDLVGEGLAVKLALILIKLEVIFGILVCIVLNLSVIVSLSRAVLILDKEPFLTIGREFDRF
jgi:hypothetical protein